MASRASSSRLARSEVVFRSVPPAPTRTSTPASTYIQLRLVLRRSSDSMRCTVALPTPTLVEIGGGAEAAIGSDAPTSVMRVAVTDGDSACMTRVRAIRCAGRGCTSNVTFGPPEPNSTVSPGVSSCSPLTRLPFRNVPLALFRSTSVKLGRSPPVTRMTACRRLAASSRAGSKATVLPGSRPS